MSLYKHIVVGTDFSPEADAALAESVRLATRHGARLTVVHVVDEQPGDQRWLVFPVSPDELRDALREKAEARLAEQIEARGIDGVKNIEVEHVVLFGRPDLELIDVALANDADLIAVGHAGDSLLERMLLGSTAERLVREAPQPILVVRPDKEPGFSRILAPVDFSEISARVLRVAASVAREEESELHVLHSYEFTALARAASASTFGNATTYQGEIEELARKDLQETIEEAGIDDVEYQSYLRTGPAATEIIEFAHHSECDLIVIACVGRAGLRRFFIGNTAERVVRGAPCSLLVIKPESFRVSATERFERRRKAVRGER